MSAPVNEGDVLAGKYRVERVLGEGGMGVVVAAMHVQLEQRVALKFLLPEAMDNEEAVGRFLREARAASRLKSEHVARVSDVGKLDGGEPYMVMEYLDGRDLSQVLEDQGRMEVVDAVDFLLQACEAIAEAHSAGIIHRDLKPANLFLAKAADGSPSVKVLDFGISKVQDAADMAMTKTTTIMGSPFYMSPEQMRSTRNVDDRSDIWALGVIFYELVTGEVPYRGETMPELCAAVLQDPPMPLSQLRPDIPAGLDETALRCLEKKPDGRYQNVAELAAALAPFGSPAAEHSAERAARVLGAPVSVSPARSQLLSRGPNSVRGGGDARTATEWGGTGADALAAGEKPERGPGIWLALGAAVVLLLGGGGYAVLSNSADSGAKAQVGAQPPPKPTPTPTETASAEPKASASAAPVPTASAAPAASSAEPTAKADKPKPKRTWHRPWPPKPKPKPEKTEPAPYDPTKDGRK